MTPWTIARTTNSTSVRIIPILRRITGSSISTDVINTAHALVNTIVPVENTGVEDTS